LDELGVWTSVDCPLFSVLCPLLFDIVDRFVWPA
jgi:hypothetical protein